MRFSGTSGKTQAESASVLFKTAFENTSIWLMLGVPFARSPVGMNHLSKVSTIASVTYIGST